MSDLSTKPLTTHSPGPSWATLQESGLSDGEVEIVSFRGPSFDKKRKGDGAGEDVSGGGPSIKRPRHSIPLAGLNERSSQSGGLSGSGALSPNSGLNAGAAKLLAAPLSPTTNRPRLSQSGKRPRLSVGSKPPRVIPRTFLAKSPGSSSKAKELSTASALAALFPSSTSHATDPGISKWREKHRNNVISHLHESSKDGERVNNLDFLWNSRAGGASSSTKAVRNVGAENSNKTMVVSTLMPTSGPTGDGPLYVNNRRQIARKTGNSSKPAKIHHFDRQLTSSSNDEGSDSSSSSSRSSQSHLSEDEASKRAFPSESRGRQGMPQPTSAPPSRNFFGKGKAVAKPRVELKRPSSVDGVIVIESSDDDKLPKKTTPVKPRGAMNKFSGKTLLSGIKRNKQTETKRRHTLGGTMDLTRALNESWRATKMKASSSSKNPIEQNFIDLTLEDSEDLAPQASDSQMEPPEELSRIVKEEKILSPTRTSSSHQSPGQILPSSPPVTPSIVGPTPTFELFRPKTTTELIPGSSFEPPKPDSSPRRRSVPVVSSSETTIDPKQSQSARTSPSTPPEDDILHRHPIIPRFRRAIVRSPEIDEMETTEEQEVLKVVVKDATLDENERFSPEIPLPSSNESSTRVSPELIPPLRRSTRLSSGSSQSELDNLVPFTEVESPPPDSSASPEPLVEVIEPPSYGGFKALTWEQHRKDINNFQFKYYSAKDLPTSLPDSINRLSEYTRSNTGIRDIFQSYILENICEDEAGAPPIEIYNDVDGEPSPAFEFIYSNKIWYGEGVPKPDFNKLKGCDCTGRCDPKSKTCACAIRQKSYMPDDGCVYDKHGRLKYPRYPIFECNDLCSCDDDCRNRVVQHGRKCQISIKKTPFKGWGVFNGPKRLSEGTFLGIYSGELLTDEQGEVRGRYYNSIGRTYLFDVDFWHLKRDSGEDDWHNKYTVDAYHAGNFTRFLNHSCDPNARLYPCYINEPDIEKPLLVVFSTRDIGPNEEICFNYSGNYLEDNQSDDDDDDGDDDDESDGTRIKKADPIYDECKCGAKNCTKILFR